MLTSKQFDNKIFYNVNKLEKKIGPFKSRKKKVIMCHGVFDIVHPGHIRHLIFAKSKADILVVSLTADIHINKGVYRPHVPEGLRAINLAAFSFIDYVLVDKNKKPLKNIEILQPNFFAKGFEYTEGSINQKTLEEENKLQSFGGELIFTPGDYVNSSSELIKHKEPDISFEKLIYILEKYKISFDDLRKSLLNLNKFNLHVFGDTIIDTFTHCKMLGGQTKTPTLSLLYDYEQNYLGGAGIVAKHIAASGAKTTFTTIIGDDKLGKFVKRECNKSKIKLNAIVDKNRPTVNKNLFISENHRLLKIGKMDTSPVTKLQIDKFCKLLKLTKTDANIFSDFRHGIFNKNNIHNYKKMLNKKTFKVADSQVASWWGNIIDFQGFDLITPNEREARFSLSDQISGVRPLAAELFNKTKTNWLMLKLGKRGVLSILNKKHNSINSYLSIDSFAKNVVDPVGAGDALLAYSTLAFLNTKNKIIASIIGTIAASCECEIDGNYPISPEKINEKIFNLEKKSIFK